jgi:hypothetical protein
VALLQPGDPVIGNEAVIYSEVPFVVDNNSDVSGTYGGVNPDPGITPIDATVQEPYTDRQPVDLQPIEPTF